MTKAISAIQVKRVEPLPADSDDNNPEPGWIPEPGWGWVVEFDDGSTIENLNQHNTHTEPKDALQAAMWRADEAIDEADSQAAWDAFCEQRDRVQARGRKLWRIKQSYGIGL